MQFISTSLIRFGSIFECKCYQRVEANQIFIVWQLVLPVYGCVFLLSMLPPSIGITRCNYNHSIYVKLMQHINTVIYTAQHRTEHIPVSLSTKHIRFASFTYTFTICLSFYRFKKKWENKFKWIQLPSIDLTGFVNFHYDYLYLIESNVRFVFGCK